MVKLDVASSDHPPPRMRISLLLEEFNEMQYPKTIGLVEGNDQETAKRFIGLYTDLENLLKTIEPVELTGFEDLVKDSVEKVIPELKRQVKSLIASSEYKPDRFRKDVFKLSKRLSLVVPPAEVDVGKPAIPVSILNAGALYKSLLAEEFYKTLGATTSRDELEVRDKIHALVLKALELSDVEVRMKDALKERSN